jgi:co-chaperonin GroES (HSP10)
MKLLNDYILVRVDDPISKTKSGFLLAEAAQRLPNSGTVEAVAAGIREVRVGDKVHFLRYAAIDGIDPDTRLCTPKHILGVFNAESA